eukprot:bmy_14472T0
MNMTLDVDTTYEFLIISDDLRNVQCGNIRGSPCFISGCHYWETVWDKAKNGAWEFAENMFTNEERSNCLLSYRAHFFPLQVQVMVIKPPWVSVLWINPNFLLFLHHNQTWTDKPKITKRFY